jgi:hypothetical protein
MKFKEDRPFTTPEAAERKLLELANPSGGYLSFTQEGADLFA